VAPRLSPHERQAKALELHLAGTSYEAIAKAVGYASKSGAYKAVRAALASQGLTAKSAEVIESELARLDALLMGLWPRARRGDVQAVDRVLKIGERRQQLLEARNAGPAEAPAPRGTALDELTQRRKQSRTRSPRPTRAAKRQ
jgi:hypothetical protein